MESRRRPWGSRHDNCSTERRDAGKLLANFAPKNINNYFSLQNPLCLFHLNLIRPDIFIETVKLLHLPLRLSSSCFSQRWDKTTGWKTTNVINVKRRRSLEGSTQLSIILDRMIHWLDRRLCLLFTYDFNQKFIRNPEDVYGIRANPQCWIDQYVLL